MSAGIDWGWGTTNVDTTTGIRYGVISQNEVLQVWADSSKADYLTPLDINDFECPECGAAYFPTKEDDWSDYVECTECGKEFELDAMDLEPYRFILDDGEYQASCEEDGDIFILKSPYFTLCRFCSPCAPGAGSLMSPDPEGIRAYCFGPDWFEGNVAPYPVYSVETGFLYL